MSPCAAREDQRAARTTRGCQSPSALNIANSTKGRQRTPRCAPLHAKDVVYMGPSRLLSALGPLFASGTSTILELLPAPTRSRTSLSNHEPSTRRYTSGPRSIRARRQVGRHRLRPLVGAWRRHNGSLARFRSSRLSGWHSRLTLRLLPD